MTVASPPSLSKVALVGTPNCGKTSLFNALTGGRERVGNYPGVTVERVTGHMKAADGSLVELADIPGLYSLRPLSVDEQVACASLSGKDQPELIVFVLDTLNLERSLFLFSQVAELGIPMAAAVTMSDLAAKEDKEASAEDLSRELGIPVVQVIAHKGDGLAELQRAAAQAHRERLVPKVRLGWPESVMNQARTLAGRPPYAALDAAQAASLIASDEDAAIDTPALASARVAAFGRNLSPRVVEAQVRHAWAAAVIKKASRGELKPNSLTSRVDAVLTHKAAGPVIFAGVMYLVFLSIYTLAGPLMTLIEDAFSWLGAAAGPVFSFNPAVQSLVVDGLIGGVGSAVVFLPQILILFTWIAILEGTGYLARASFLMDRLLGWCGLNGRAFIPLLSSFACAIPGIMAARVMPDGRSRLATILVAPLMSCSARLPVYVLMIGAFVEPQFGPWWAAFFLFAMHFVGLAVAVPTIWVLNRALLKGGRLPFVMDLPRYQWPKLRDVWRTVWGRGSVFLKTAGTIIVVMSVVMWGLLYFPRSEEAFSQYKADHARLAPGIEEDVYVAQRQRADSALGRFGRFLEPAFLPAGFDWRMTTAILAAFPAREVVVSAMGVLFSVGDAAEEKDLRAAMAAATWPDGRPLITIWNAAGLMVFFALCAQCMSTLAVMRRETGSWKWPVVSFAYMTGLAYLSAVVIFQVGRLVGGA